MPLCAVPQPHGHWQKEFRAGIEATISRAAVHARNRADAQWIDVVRSSV
jgi:hypothetical protein